jgi:hypothetical protein
VHKKHIVPFLHANLSSQVLMGLAAGVHTCYGLTVGEICPNRFKFVGVAFACLPNIISTGFGQYLGMLLPRPSTMVLTAQVFESSIITTGGELLSIPHKCLGLTGVP